MTEHAPLPYQDAEPTPERETSAVTQPRAIEPTPVYDAAFGQGDLYTFPDNYTTLELYPTGTIFTYQAVESMIAVRVSETGEVDFIRSPVAAPEAVEPLVTAETATPQHILPPPPEPAVSAPSTASEEHAKRQQPEQEKKVEIVGRVGTLPTFRQTKKGLMARFALAEHPDADTTIWHNVVAFGSKAEQLKDSLTIGEAVKIVGKPFTWQARTKKGGNPKPEQAISLWGLKHLDKNQ